MVFVNKGQIIDIFKADRTAFVNKRRVKFSLFFEISTFQTTFDLSKTFFVRKNFTFKLFVTVEMV